MRNSQLSARVDFGGLCLSGRHLGGMRTKSDAEGDRIRVTVRTVSQNCCRVQLTVVERCPICFELCDNVEQLPHPFASDSTSVSAHKLCKRCRERWPGECPFCRSAPLPPPPVGFVGIYKSTSASPDSNALGAAVPLSVDRLHERKRRSLVARVTWRVFPRMRRATSAGAIAARRPCRGCKHGCLECDPRGDLLDPDDWGVSLTGL
jgi:hypothetical protein